MPKFTFPVSIEGLRKVLSTDEGKKVLQAFGADDNVAYAISCMRAGYINKMHHKERQEEDRLLKELLKNDPQLKASVQKRVQAQLGRKSA